MRMAHMCGRLPVATYVVPMDGRTPARDPSFDSGEPNKTFVQSWSLSTGCDCSLVMSKSAMIDANIEKRTWSPNPTSLTPAVPRRTHTVTDGCRERGGVGTRTPRNGAECPCCTQANSSGLHRQGRRGGRAMQREQKKTGCNAADALVPTARDHNNFGMNRSVSALSSGWYLHQKSTIFMQARM